MGFLDDANLDDVQEPTAVPGDSEYKLMIVDVKTDPSTANGLPVNKNGDSYLLPRFEIVGEPAAKELTRYFGLPNAGMNDKQRNAAGWQLKQFLNAFDLDPNQLADPNDLVGAEGWAILGLEESDQWGEQNFVKKFIVPK